MSGSVEEEAADVAGSAEAGPEDVAGPAVAADVAGPTGESVSAAEPVLRVTDLTVTFPVRRGWLQRQVGSVRAVDGVSFEVLRGTTLGLVGESGCGKSTTGRAILKLVEPTSGRVEICGEDVTRLSAREMRRVRPKVQMVFQDPFASLNPRMTVVDTVTEPLRVHGRVKGRETIEANGAELLRRVGLSSRYMRRYPHELSGGQRQRVGIARAIALSPELLILDEPVSALDVSIQAQIVNLLGDLQSSLGLTYVFVAHDLSVVRHLSTEIAVMYLGRIVEKAPAEELFERPMHPYTEALLSAVPVPDPVLARSKKRLPLAGEVPSAQDPPSGCAFHPRCPKREERCEESAPELRARSGGHSVACHVVE
ncbi:MAG: ATP-binding cassette domain-containing protein [Polyangiaceae bacterium]